MGIQDNGDQPREKQDELKDVAISAKQPNKMKVEQWQLAILE